MVQVIEQQLEGARQPVTEEPAWFLPGVQMLLLGIVVILVGIAVGVSASHLTGAASDGLVVLTVLIVLCGGLMLAGLTPVSPGHARVIQLFGRYCGTIRDAGLMWVNPLTKRLVVSTRIRNQESTQLKVNDADGNPIEIAAVVVWQVKDTAHAIYSVDEVTKFVTIQMETAVRHIASSYPYDSRGEDRLSLRDNADEITQQLSTELTKRVTLAGVQVIETRLTRLLRSRDRPDHAAPAAGQRGHRRANTYRRRRGRHGPHRPAAP